MEPANTSDETTESEEVRFDGYTHAMPLNEATFFDLLSRTDFFARTVSNRFNCDKALFEADGTVTKPDVSILETRAHHAFSSIDDYIRVALEKFDQHVVDRPTHFQFDDGPKLDLLSTQFQTYTLFWSEGAGMHIAPLIAHELTNGCRLSTLFANVSRLRTDCLFRNGADEHRDHFVTIIWLTEQLIFKRANIIAASANSENDEILVLHLEKLNILSRHFFIARKIYMASGEYYRRRRPRQYSLVALAGVLSFVPVIAPLGYLGLLLAGYPLARDFYHEKQCVIPQFVKSLVF